MSNMQENQVEAIERTMSRRSFVAGGAAALAVSALGMSGCSGTPSEMANTSGVAWGEETDVVVVGFGGAGATAAVGAAESGASVVLLEKAPEGDEGGNTSVCGGGARIGDESSIDRLVANFQEILPKSGWDEEEATALAEDVCSVKKWLEDHGAKTTVMAEFEPDSYNGEQGYTAMFNIGGNGYSLFQFLKDLVESTAGIQVRYETPVKRLIFDPETKEVFGVVAVGADGQETNIKAKRGVVLACGGFEGNQEMKDAYYAPDVPTYPLGSPYNTGDGIGMLMDVGAKMRGFGSIEWGNHVNKLGSDEVGVGLSMSMLRPEEYSHSIVVNNRGKRFVGETAPGYNGTGVLRPLHDKSQIPELAFDMLDTRGGLYDGQYANLPMYLICDQARIDEGPLFTSASSQAGNCWAHLHDWYTWSDDNRTEVQKGWVSKCDTLEELAATLGIDPAGLKETVEAYNAACETGEDLFESSIELKPISTPPFYGCELGIGIINTQGGAKRNGSYQVINREGAVVPRLYECGELGSFYTWKYPGACNLPEALCSHVAGEHVAAEEPWC